MPIYEFACETCKVNAEIELSIKDKTIPNCQGCGKVMKKVFSLGGIIFKGTGFYKTGG